MVFIKKYFFLILILLVCVTFSGCALLQAPIELVKLPFMLVGEVLKLISKMPKPPPGVF